MSKEVRHYFSPSDISDGERNHILDRARELKTRGGPPTPSAIRFGSLFFNPSLRTRVSFEQASWLLGGSCQTLDAGVGTWGLELDPNAVMDRDRAENIVEAARVLGRYFHLLGVRSFGENGPWLEERREPLLRAFAEHSGIPVVNLEGALHHPCQSLADVLTMQEHFDSNLQGLPVALTWAWHPRALPVAVPHSFLLQAALAGCAIRVAHPQGYDLDEKVILEARSACASSGGSLTFTNQQDEAVAGAQVVYVKSWAPPGTTTPPDTTLKDWIITGETLKHGESPRLMHCLPVRRNVVISSDVLDGSASIITDQAENRLWAQAALMEFMIQETYGGIL